MLHATSSEQRATSDTQDAASASQINYAF